MYTGAAASYIFYVLDTTIPKLLSSWYIYLVCAMANYIKNFILKIVAVNIKKKNTATLCVSARKSKKRSM